MKNPLLLQAIHCPKCPVDVCVGKGEGVLQSSSHGSLPQMIGPQFDSSQQPTSNYSSLYVMYNKSQENERLSSMGLP